MSAEWPEARLGDLVDIKHGFAFKGEFFTDQPTGAVLLTPGNFAIGGGFQFNKLKFYRDGPIPPDYVLQTGDLLVTMTDLSKAGDTLGYSAVVPDSDYLMLHNQRLGKVTAKNQGIDLGFIHWLLRDERYRAEVLGSATGSTVKHTSPNRIGAYRFRLPPLPEQRAIAATLGALDDKIELNRKMNATLEAMAQALFRDWFVDFGPTRAKKEGRPAYLSEDLWSLFPDCLDAKGKPEGWREGVLSDFIQFNPTEALSKGVSAPYIEMAALPTSGSVTDPAVEREFGSGMKFRDGDALFARITPCLENGKSAYVQGLGSGVVAWGSTEFIVMRARPPVPAPVSYLIARDTDFRSHAIRSMTGTSGRQRAQTDILASYPVAVPDEPEIWIQLGILLEPMFAKIEANASESRTLAQTRDLLLPRLVSGEINVHAVELVE